MTRPLTKGKVKNIRSAYVELKSLGKVSRLFRISKSTAHKYIYDLAPHQNIITSLRSNDQRLLGTYVGLWMGDGTQYYDDNFTIKICSNKKDVLLNKFIQEIIFNLFGKTSSLNGDSKTSRAYVRFHSKFIYDFISNYVQHENNKTHSVRLKYDIDSYSTEFLEGCLLGLTLSDGYLKKCFVFNVTSERLSTNMKDILIKFGFNPRLYTFKRERFGHKDLQSIRLIVKESRIVENLLDKVILDLGYHYSFNELKYSREQIK